MTLLSRSNYQSSISSTHADNTTGDISAADGKGGYEDLSDSAVFKHDDHYPRYSVTTGTSTSYAVTVPHPSTYTEGIAISIKPHTTNTGASTITVTPTGGSALGAKEIRDRSGLAIGSGDLQSGQYYLIQYDGTYFRIVSGYNSSTSLLTVTTEIGDWNMQGNASVGVTISGLDFKKIRMMDAIIRNDSDNAYYHMGHNAMNDPELGYSGSFGDSSGDTVLTLQRKAGTGTFNSADFNATSYNRGWVTVWYTA